MATSDDDLPSEARIADALKHRFFLRVHMLLILGITFAAGLAATKVMLMLHIHSMAWRYGMAVCVSFGAFLACVRGWLMYIGYCAASDRRASGSSSGSRSSSSSGAWFDCVDFGGSGIDFGGSSSSSSVDLGGGKFGGGGASGSWGDADANLRPVMAVPMSNSSAGSSSGGLSKGIGGLFDVDFGDDGALLLLVIALVAVILLAGFYLIYAAPVILAEAAFNAALAAALARKTRKITKAVDWVGSVFRSTVFPFLAIFAIAVTLGWYAQHRCPGATRLRDALHCATNQ